MKEGRLGNQAEEGRWHTRMATDEDGLQSGRPVQSDGGRTRQQGEWTGPRAEKE